jgi:uncharacterized membrane protein
MRASKSACRPAFSAARFTCQRPSETVSAMNSAAAMVVTRRGAKENGPMRIVIIVLLIVVLVSLFSGLYFVYKDKGSTNRAVIALTIRIAVSVLVFAILIASYYFGWIPERGL